MRIHYYNGYRLAIENGREVGRGPHQIWDRLG